ncbi:uncharacterized protein LOC117123429 [Anneissia japonica]|uniref:uncharacterized protein LOC117123429 n=1 Tax=Anneissia japonica TaxID=1529436 RepID=UPI0014259573|nr:uncharacterized protein LOC117123429 [Anneissia japonica]
MPKTQRMEEKFRDFLVKLSGYFSGIRVRWLRCLLYDHIVLAELSRSNIDLIGLFNKLADQDEISYNNVDLLSEIAELTKEKPAISHVNAYKKAIQRHYVPITDRKELTLYRKNLFKALRAVKEDELQSLANSYQQDYSEFKNIWDLVFFLETYKRLEDKQDKIKKFGDLLNPTAKDIFLNGLRTSSRKRKGEQSRASSISRPDDPDALDGLGTSKRKDTFSKRKKGEQTAARSSNRPDDSDSSDDICFG